MDGGGGDSCSPTRDDPQAAAAAAADPGEGYEAFGSMAPCWGLLQRAKSYMTPVCVDARRTEASTYVRFRVLR